MDTAFEIMAFTLLGLLGLALVAVCVFVGYMIRDINRIDRQTEAIRAARRAQFLDKPPTWSPEK